MPRIIIKVTSEKYVRIMQRGLQWEAECAAKRLRARYLDPERAQRCLLLFSPLPFIPLFLSFLFLHHLHLKPPLPHPPPPTPTTPPPSPSPPPPPPPPPPLLHGLYLLGEIRRGSHLSAKKQSRMSTLGTSSPSTPSLRSAVSNKDNTKENKTID